MVSSALPPKAVAFDQAGAPPEKLDTEPDHVGALLSDVVAVTTGRV